MGTLTLTNVTKSFGSIEVIKPTNLTIEDGEFVVFVGPSGCGKSTMLRMIAGLENITSGTLEIDGRKVNDLAPVERGIAMVFQSYALYPHMTVYENIAFPLRVAKMSKPEVDRRVKAAAEVLQLTNRLQQKPGQLSGGQRQRVAIGRSIVREPSVFLFDEPLSNLDAALRMDMRMEIAQLHQRLGASMIYVTHDQVEAMTLADKIVVMKDGVVMQAGAPMDLYHNPANKFVASFLGAPSMNFIDVTVDEAQGGEAKVSAPSLAPVVVANRDGLEKGARAALGIRPQYMWVVPEGRLSGQVQITERLGSDTVINVRLEDGSEILAAEAKDLVLEPGHAISFDFDPAQAHLFAAD